MAEPRRDSSVGALTHWRPRSTSRSRSCSWLARLTSAEISYGSSATPTNDVAWEEGRPREGARGTLPLVHATRKPRPGRAGRAWSPRHGDSISGRTSGSSGARARGVAHAAKARRADRVRDVTGIAPDQMAERPASRPTARAASSAASRPRPERRWAITEAVIGVGINVRTWPSGWGRRRGGGSGRADASPHGEDKERLRPPNSSSRISWPWGTRSGGSITQTARPTSCRAAARPRRCGDGACASIRAGARSRAWRRISPRTAASSSVCSRVRTS